MGLGSSTSTSLSPLWTTPTVLVGLVLAYSIVVAMFRYQRARYHVQLFQEAEKKNRDKDNKNEEEFVETCRQINESLATLEFPMVYHLSLQFALFRTSAIPSISGLLEKTKVFATKCGKRCDDTDLLLAEMILNPFSSDRSNRAVDRINWIHSQYKNKISNDDMLYVLSVFMLEPIRFIERIEWRSLNAVECQALYLTWTEIGKKMGIQKLPSSLTAMKIWNEQYERTKMVYESSNTVIAKSTIALFLSLVPTFLHPFGHKVAYCLMDKRLRKAMGFPDPPLWLQATVDLFLTLRKLCIRVVFLPRPAFLEAKRIPQQGRVDDIFVPRFNIYEHTYNKDKGYKIDAMGEAPPGKVFTGCPVYHG